MSPDFLNLPDRRLAYQRSRGREDRPGVVFCGGFASDMTGTKASFLAERCAQAGLAFLRFDYRGHGQSSGDFRHGTIGGWFEDAQMVFDRLTAGPQIVVGSSMGGWLGLILTRERPGSVAALVGVAAAPDFTEDLIWDKLPPDQRAQLLRTGEIADPAAPNPGFAPITFRLIEEARKHLLLRGPLDISCPVRLLQGMRDSEVPWQHALRIAERVMNDDVHVDLIKDGDHRLSRSQDLALLWQTVEALLQGPGFRA